MNIHVYDDYLTINCADGEFTFSYRAQIAGAPVTPDILRRAYESTALFEAARQHLPAEVDLLIESLHDMTLKQPGAY
jgi:hypothetical protein